MHPKNNRNRLGRKELQSLILNLERFALFLYFTFFVPARNFPDEIIHRISPSLFPLLGWATKIKSKNKKVDLMFENRVSNIKPALLNRIKLEDEIKAIKIKISEQ